MAKGLPKTLGVDSPGFIPKLKRYTVATVPSAPANPDALIIVTDGNAGAECLAFSDGTDWLAAASGSAVATE